MFWKSEKYKIWKIVKIWKILKIWPFLKEFWGLPCREIERDLNLKIQKFRPKAKHATHPMTIPLKRLVKIINFSPHPWCGVEAVTLDGADCLAWHGRPGRKDSSSFWACWTPPWPSKGGKDCCLMQWRPLTSTPWGRCLKASSSLRVRAVVKKESLLLGA